MAKPPPSMLQAKLAGAPVAVNAIDSVVVLIVAGTEVVMLVARRCGVDRPGGRRRARVGITNCVGRTDGERVGSISETG